MGMDRIKKKSRFPLKWILGISIPVGFIGVFAYQMLYVDNTPVVFARAEELKITEVFQGEFQEYINVQGAIIPGATMYIDAGEAGTVQEVLVEQGSAVEKGQTIAQLGNAELELNLSAQKTRILEQEYELEDAKLAAEQQKAALNAELLDLDFRLHQLKQEYTRKKGLFDQHIISATDFEQTQAEYEFWQQKKTLLIESNERDLRLMVQKQKKIQAGRQLLQTELQGIQQRIANLRITAPAAGQLTQLHAMTGETKYKGARIAQLDLTESYKMRTTIDEYYLAKVAVGTMGSVQAPKPDSEEMEAYAVTIAWISPDVQNNAFEVELTFAERTPANVRLGQGFLIRLELGEKKETLMLARGPFMQTSGGTWAYVVDTSGATATKRTIQVGRQNPEYIEVIAGLDAGERVIISRYDDYENVAQIVLN